MTTTPTRTTESSILASLRALTPGARLDFNDALALTERQAALLRRLLLTPGDVLDEHHLAALPRLRIVRDTCPTSGLSYWSGTEWIIVLNRTDNPARQRFTLLHEYKHIIDHGHAARLYRRRREAERAADYFAGCALVPKLELKRAFYAGTQRIEDLAAYFGVSRAAIRVRIDQAGLVDSQPFTRERCARPISTPWHEEQRFVPVAAWPSGG